MKKYILIQPDEDGNPIRWLDDNEVEDISQLKEDYDVTEFFSELPREKNPNYWDDGQALLCEVIVKKVTPVKIVQEYKLE